MLPLAELHLHIEGTLEADLLVRLARRNGVPLPSENPAELTARYADFADLQAFLDVYYANLAVLRTEEDFRDLAAAYLSRAAAAGVRRAEIFCDPQTHLGNGVPLEVVFGGLGAALAEARGSRALRRPHRLLPARPRRRGGRGPAASGAAVPASTSSAWGWTPRRWAGRRGCSRRPTTWPPPRACTGWRTPARRAAPSTSARRSTCSASSGSTTATAPWRTPTWWPGCATSGCR